MKLLVPHDGSEHAYKTLDEALKLADKLGEAEIVALVVVTDLCLLGIGIDECKAITVIQHREAEGIKAEIEQILADHKITAKVLIKSGVAESSILEAADEIGADLIVIGAVGKHRREVHGSMGGVALKVVSRSQCNVMVIK